MIRKLINLLLHEWRWGECGDCTVPLDLREPHVAEARVLERMDWRGNIKLLASTVTVRRHLSCARLLEEGTVVHDEVERLVRADRKAVVSIPGLQMDPAPWTESWARAAQRGDR